MTLKTTKNMCRGLSVVYKIITRRSTIDVREKIGPPKKIRPLVHPDISDWPQPVDCCWNFGVESIPGYHYNIYFVTNKLYAFPFHYRWVISGLVMTVIGIWTDPIGMSEQLKIIYDHGLESGLKRWNLQFKKIVKNFNSKANFQFQ